MLDQIMRNHEAKHSTTAVAANPEDLPRAAGVASQAASKEPSVPDESLRLEVE